MVDVIIFTQYQLGNGDKGIPLLNEFFDESRQRGRRVFGGVVKQDDRARGDALDRKSVV